MSTTPKPKAATKLLRQLALALPEAAEAPHFESSSFRVRGKIFATFSDGETSAVVKMAPPMQEAMIEAHGAAFEPVEGYWGRSGWTRVHLAKIPPALLEDVLVSAWAGVAPKALVKAHAPKLRKAQETKGA